ncbi:MAG: UbiA family prenyltransferase [Hyphomicrobium sp.]
MKVSSREPSTSTRAKGLIADNLRALRPHQWLKNVLVAVPAIAAHRVSNETIGNVLLAFVAFSLCASAVYVINDLIDREHDRKHPRKRNRPFASWALTPGFGVGLAVALLAGALGISFFLPQAFLLVLCGYFILTLAYSVYLKRFLMLDVLVLACLYGIRVVAGGVAAAVPISEWLIAFCVFFFLSLALVKRTAELKDSPQETDAQLPGRAYRAEDAQALQALAGAAGLVSVLVLALYVSSPQVQTLYSHPVGIWGVGLVLVVWIGRVILITGRGQMHDDPVIFAATDRASLVLVLTAAVILGLSL